MIEITPQKIGKPIYSLGNKTPEKGVKIVIRRISKLLGH